MTPTSRGNVASRNPANQQGRRKEAQWRVWLEPGADPEIRYWYDNLARGSQQTAEEQIRVLWRYCRDEHTTPQDLAQEAKDNVRAAENRISNLITAMEAAGKSPSYIQQYVTVSKSWLRHHNVLLARRFKIKNANATPTLEGERVPTREELRAIKASATPRGRVIADFMALAGLRPEVLGDHRGRDGLRLGDLPDLKVEGYTAHFEQIPAIVRVRSELSKTGHGYFSMLPAEGCEDLCAYLEQRMAANERLTPASAVVAVKPGYEKMGQYDGPKPEGFIVTRNITREVREAMRPRYTWRPYVLRSYFDTQLLLAESNGKIVRDFRVFFMGHTGDIESTYTTKKGRLPQELVAEMRRSFLEASVHLETVERRETGDPTLQMARALLELQGKTPAEISAMGLERKSKNALTALLVEAVTGPSGGPRQRIVSLVELDGLIAAGWMFRQTLPDGRVVVETST